ncbi:MAG: FAD-binding oxidoreductase, partial [Chloroflexota bacterium]|nr:FAD-binding oxidoreductase [Chloroflexota bacterium]
MGRGAASDLPGSADVAILGAGVIGCAIADALSGRGLSVAVLDPTGVAAGASAGAAGLLAPLVEAPGPGPFLTLGLASLQRFPRLSEELHEETGIDVGWRERATLRVAETEQEVAELRARVAWQSAQALEVEWLDAAALRDAEPLLREGVAG